MSEAAITGAVEEEEEEEEAVEAMETLNLSGLRRKEKRKAGKKLKRKQTRKETALKAREEEEARLNDEEDQRRIVLEEQEEAEIMERQRKEFEEREKLWVERAAKKAEEEAQRRLLEDESREKQGVFEDGYRKKQQSNNEDELSEDDAWDYVEEGPAEIIWQGNEIIVKKKTVRVPKRSCDRQSHDKDTDRPTSNPRPPQSEAFASYKNRSSVSSQEVFESVAQQTPNFETEQDKALISKLEPVVLDHAAAEFTFILINRAHCLSRICTMDLALPGSKMRGLSIQMKRLSAATKSFMKMYIQNS